MTRRARTRGEKFAIQLRGCLCATEVVTPLRRRFPSSHKRQKWYTSGDDGRSAHHISLLLHLNTAWVKTHIGTVLLQSIVHTSHESFYKLLIIIVMVTICEVLKKILLDLLDWWLHSTARLYLLYLSMVCMQNGILPFSQTAHWILGPEKDWRRNTEQVPFRRVFLQIGKSIWYSRCLFLGHHRSAEYIPMCLNIWQVPYSMHLPLITNVSIHFRTASTSSQVEFGRGKRCIKRGFELKLCYACICVWCHWRPRAHNNFRRTASFKSINYNRILYSATSM